MITYSKQVPGQTRRIQFANEVFDPGDPLPISTVGMRRVGADS